MIYSHKMIYNIFGSGIYYKPYSIFKSKSQKFQNKNIRIFSGNDTWMAGYFVGMHRDLQMQQVLQSTISSIEFVFIPTNAKFDKAVGYIYDNKSWERCYLLLNILFPSLRFLCLEDSNHADMERKIISIRELKISALGK